MTLARLEVAHTPEGFTLAVQWYYLDDDKRIGPITGTRLKELVDKGVIVPWTPVVRTSQGKRSPWMKAGVLEALFPQGTGVLLGDPICEKCGAKQVDGRCAKCDPPLPPPPPLEMEARAEQVPEFDSTQKAPPVPGLEQRYTNLRKYVDAIKSWARFVYFMGMLLAVLSFFAGVYLAAETRQIVPVGFGLLAALFIYGVTDWIYVLIMAFAETFQVVMDTEENTRRTEINTRTNTPLAPSANEIEPEDG